MDGLATSSASVPDGEEVSAHLTLESILDGDLTVTGVVVAPWIGECRRCLRPVRGELRSPIRELFEPARAGGPLDEDSYLLEGEQVDLEAPIRDVVLLNLPLAPLCAESCAGPDPDAHPVSVEGVPRSERGSADPVERAAEADERWAPLRDLKFD